MLLFLVMGFLELFFFKRLSVHKGKPEEDQNCEISKPHLPHVRQLFLLSVETQPFVIDSTKC